MLKGNVIYITKSCASNEEIADVVFLPPLGIMSIATVLETNGYNVKVIDYSLEFMNSGRLIELIKELNPLYIGISTYTENIDENLELCKYIKKNFKDMPILIGGPHATVDYEYCERKKFIDFIVVGEGESTNLQVTEAIRTNERLIKFEDIDGLVYYSKKEKKYIKNDCNQYIKNLDLLPIVKRQYISKSLNGELVTIFSSRGCPGKCIYCAASSLAGSKYRIRDIESVFLETLMLLKLVNYNAEIYYCDDTFTSVLKRVEYFLELIDKSGITIRWRCESRVDALNKNKFIVNEMAKRGCQRLQYGIESGNQQVLDCIFKNLDLSVVEDLIEHTISCGIRVAASFIFGHYCDTEETMLDTLLLMVNLKEKHKNKIEIFYSYNTPFPGTYQYEHRKELGIRLLINKYSELTMLDPVMETDNFNVSTLKQIGQKAQALMV